MLSTQGMRKTSIATPSLKILSFPQYVGCENSIASKIAEYSWNDTVYRWRKKKICEGQFDGKDLADSSAFDPASAEGTSDETPARRQNERGNEGHTGMDVVVTRFRKENIPWKNKRGSPSSFHPSLRLQRATEAFLAAYPCMRTALHMSSFSILSPKHSCHNVESAWEPQNAWKLPQESST